jgi:hypothetical protein
MFKFKREAFVSLYGTQSYFLTAVWSWKQPQWTIPVVRGAAMNVLYVYISGVYSYIILRIMRNALREEIQV